MIPQEPQPDVYELPEHVRKYCIQMKNDRKYWYCLLALGALALLNAVVSTMMKPADVTQ